MTASSLSPTEFASVVTAITSAFGDPTRREIYLFARSTPLGVTAAETAAHFELHPNVARHHLDKLAAGGYLDVATGRPGAGAGRPSKRYRVADDATPLEMPVRNDDVIIALLGRALAELGAERAEQLAEEVGVEYGRTMGEALGGSTQRSVRTALHAVADALSAHGFAAHTEGSGESLTLVSTHCPFGEAVIEHPVMCAIDRGMVRGMLGSLYGETSVDLQSSKPMGDDICVTSVE
ncbi:MAG TPA: helix-turn-helix domain-containing protein [Microthrixaceae bacterium]|nr:helix-turn-helix domain-containing protein [Microthrixaceae bacterium]